MHRNQPTDTLPRPDPTYAWTPEEPRPDDTAGRWDIKVIAGRSVQATFPGKGTFAQFRADVDSRRRRWPSLRYAATFHPTS